MGQKPSSRRQTLIYIGAGIAAFIGIAAIVTVVYVTTRAAVASLRTPEPTSILDVILTPGALSAEDVTQAPASSGPAGRIVYSCFDGTVDQLCTINADGSDQVQLTDEFATDWYASFSPDGSAIVFSSRRSGLFEVHLMDSAGVEVTRLTTTTSDCYAPEISPDGLRVVYAATAGNDHLDIYVMGIDGANPVRLTDNPAQDLDPTWSPDGTQISFASNRSGSNELYIMNADGSNVQQVTSGSGMGGAGRSDWSPDGTTLAFYAGPDGDRNIFTVPVACAEQPSGCGPEQITQLTDGGNNKAPSYSPDGRWIAFASNLYGDNDIFVMRADGTDWRQITDNDTADWQPRWGRADY